MRALYSFSRICGILAILCAIPTFLFGTGAAFPLTILLAAVTGFLAQAWLLSFLLYLHAKAVTNPRADPVPRVPTRAETDLTRYRKPKF